MRRKEIYKLIISLASKDSSNCIEFINSEHRHSICACTTSARDDHYYTIAYYKLRKYDHRDILENRICIKMFVSYYLSRPVFLDFEFRFL
jgi:hypothetical protein